MRPILLCRFAGFLVFGSLALAMLGTPLRAQDLRQWMPNVGDRFLCAFEYYCPCGEDQELFGSDTVLFTVIAEESLDSLHSDVIVTKNEDIASHFRHSGQIPSPSDTVNPTHFSDTSYIAFEPPSILQSSITTGTLAPHDSMWAYVLNVGNDTTAMYQGDTLSSVLLATAPANYGNPSPWYDSWMNFVPALGWFADLGGRNMQADPATALDQENWSGELILYSKPLRSVAPNSIDAGIIVSQAPGWLNLKFPASFSERFSTTLLDPLGRAIRSWQMPVEAGGREITLNVADVPSGVYFLRISGAGIQELKKVWIAH